MPAVAKLCCVCGEDVAAKKRMKDPQGQYYCVPCYATRLSKSKPSKSHKTTLGAAIPISDSPGGVATEAPPEFPPADDGLLDLAPEKKHEGAPDEEMFGCSGCKKIVPKRQIRNLDGEFLCTSCHGKQHAHQRANAPRHKPVAKAKDEFADEHPEGWTDSITGGLTVSAAIVAAATCAFIGLNYAMPPRGAGDQRVILAFAYGGISVVFLFFRVICLMISMITASKIMGGMTFGSIGSALYKTFALFSIYGIIDFFLERSDYAMIGWGAKFGAFVMCFIALYGLDYFEAVLLAVINMAMAWVLSIVMAIALLAALSAISGHSSGGDDDEGPGLEHIQPALPQNGGAAGGGGAAAQPDNGIDD